MTIVYAVLVLGVTAVIFGLILAFAAKVFEVEVDPRLPEIQSALAGANCGGCGYPGCDGYASGVVNDGAATNRCSVGGAPVAQKIAEIMGVKAEAAEPMRAFVRCKGTNEASPRQVEYDGVKDCRAAATVPGGSPNACPFGCIGFGTCVSVCPFGALSMENGLPKVNTDKCTGCGVCVSNCPKAVLTLVPRKANIVVACNSHWKGPMVRKVCSAGCIGCGMCARECPVQAITLDHDLAVIDPNKCIGCGRCVSKCPTKCIAADLACVQEKTA